MLKSLGRIIMETLDHKSTTENSEWRDLSSELHKAGYDVFKICRIQQQEGS